jgi:hypothetical protein
MENPLPVRQALLSYLAVKEEIAMQATIRYIAAHHGSTGNLSLLMVRTDQSVAALAAAGSDTALDQELENLRALTRVFREETELQITIIDGKPEDLRAEIQSATGQHTGLRLLLDRYWSVREESELAAFDQQMNRFRELHGTAGEDHDNSTAQKKLREIAMVCARNLKPHSGHAMIPVSNWRAGRSMERVLNTPR